MRRKIISVWRRWPLAVAMSLTGCTVNMVSTRDTSGGVIRYQLAEHLYQNQGRREKAYKEMHAFCQGPYRLTDESSVEPASVVEDSSQKKSLGHKLMMMSTEAYWYMTFACETAGRAVSGKEK
jgi:hypothetical protein